MTILFVLSGAVRAENDGEDVSGELHCILGAVGILFVIMFFITGFLISGRFRHKKELKLIPIHMLGVILMSIYFTGEFIFGLIKAHWFFSYSFHSLVGFFIPVFAWLITGLSPCFAGKVINPKISSRVHAILSIVLLILVIIQVLYGYLYLD
jgi:hypothetical protein